MKRRSFLAAAASLVITPLPAVKMGLIQRVTLSANKALTFTHPMGDAIQIRIVQGDGAHGVKWPPGIEWSEKANV